MANVDTIRALSDPFKVERVLFVMEPFLEDFLANKSKFKIVPKNLEILLGDAFEKIPRVKGALERDNLYMKEIFRALPGLRKELGKKYKYIIFTTGVSPDATKVGIPGRVGYDFAAQLNFLSESIWRNAIKSPEAYSSVVFWPVVIEDMPFVFNPGEKKLKHITPNIILKVNQEMEKEGKAGFGTIEKGLGLEDVVKGAEGNYQFSEILFDFKVFKRRVNANPSMYVDEIREFGRDEFFNLAKSHIWLNRELMVQKYLRLAEELELKTFFNQLEKEGKVSGVPLYSIKGSYATKIFDKVAKRLNLKLDFIGGDEGVMRNIKKPSLEMGKREVAVSTLTLLDRRILNIFSHETGIFPKIEQERGKKQMAQKIQFKSCYKYPYVLCEVSCGTMQEEQKYCTKEMINEYIKKQNPGGLELLSAETKKDNYGVAPIESFLIRLKNRDFEVVGKEKERYSLDKLLNVLSREGKFVPLCFDDIQYNNYDLRASEFTTNCNLARIISKIDEEKLPIEIKENEKAIIGKIIHQIMNQQPPNWLEFLHNRLLEHINSRIVKRNKYCEKSVLYNYKGVKISGHPDCSIRLEEKDKTREQQDIGVMEIKHKIYTGEKEYKGYLYQGLLYCFGLKQNLNLRPENFYLFFIERPFVKPKEEATKLLPVDKGSYRQQKIFLKLVKEGDPIIDELHREILQTYEVQKNILQSKKAMLAEREKYQGNEKIGCDRPCFDIEVCNYLFDEVKRYANLAEMLKGKYPTLKHRSSLRF